MTTATATRRDPIALIETAEALLALKEPTPGPYWPTSRPGQSESALDNVVWDNFQFNLLSDRGGEYPATTDEEILTIDPGFRRECLLDAIEEVLTFARLFLHEDRPGDNQTFRFQNIHLQDEVRCVVRRHLVKLLGRWYDMETAGGAG